MRDGWRKRAAKDGVEIAVRCGHLVVGLWWLSAGSANNSDGELGQDCSYLGRGIRNKVQLCLTLAGQLQNHGQEKLRN